MKPNEVLNKVKELLGMQVNLATMKLSDGVTVLEAEAFEAGKEVFVVAEDQKIALPVGEYELEDGKMLIVQQEGIIAEVKEADVKEEEMPMEQPEAEVPVEASVEQAAKKVVESTVKETYFAEMEELKKENEELKAKLQELSEVKPTSDSTETTPTSDTTEVELNDVKPITFNPENTNPVEEVKFSQNRPDTTLDRVLAKLNK